MRRDAMNAPVVSLGPPVQFEGKHQHRQFGLPVRPHRRVIMFRLEVFQIQDRPAMRNAGHIHHPAPAKPILQVRS